MIISVSGFEIGHIVCGGFIMSEPNSTFVYLWLNNMLNDYNVQRWAYISGLLPSRLVKRYNASGLVHVIPKKLHRPNYNDFKKLLGSETFEWENNFAIHTFQRVWPNQQYNKVTLPELNPETIKTMNNTFGQIARKICYGSSDLILS